MSVFLGSEQARHVAADPRFAFRVSVCFNHALFMPNFLSWACGPSPCLPEQVFVFNAENYSGDAQLVNRQGHSPLVCSACLGK